MEARAWVSCAKYFISTRKKSRKRPSRLRPSSFIKSEAKPWSVSLAFEVCLNAKKRRQWPSWGDRPLFSMRQLQPRQDTLPISTHPSFSSTPSSHPPPWEDRPTRVARWTRVGGPETSIGHVTSISARTRDTGVGSGPHLGTLHMGFTTTKRIFSLLCKSCWSLALHVKAQGTGLGDLSSQACSWPTPPKPRTVYGAGRCLLSGPGLLVCLRETLGGERLIPKSERGPNISPTRQDVPGEETGKGANKTHVTIKPRGKRIVVYLLLKQHWATLQVAIKCRA